MSLFFVSLVRGNASEVSESTRVNFKPCWCLSDAVNDKENPRKLWCPINIRDYEQRSRDRASVCACVGAGVRSVTLCCSSYWP